MMNSLYGRSRFKAADDPVAIEVHLARLVFLVAVRVGVTSGVEPDPAPALAIVRRIEQPLDLLLHGVTARSARNASSSSIAGGRPIRSRQSRLSSVALLSLGRGLEPIRFEPRQDEEVDRIAAPAPILDRRQRGPRRRNERPVPLVRGSFLDPSLEQAISAAESDLPLSLGGIRSSSILGRDPRVELALLDLARHDRHAPGARRPLGVALIVEPQLPFRCLASGPWHLKHLSARIGRMSRLNESFWPREQRRRQPLPVPPPTCTIKSVNPAASIGPIELPGMRIMRRLPRQAGSHGGE